jgi:hypothetical protein
MSSQPAFVNEGPPVFCWQDLIVPPLRHLSRLCTTLVLVLPDAFLAFLLYTLGLLRFLAHGNLDVTMDDVKAAHLGNCTGLRSGSGNRPAKRRALPKVMPWEGLAASIT